MTATRARVVRVSCLPVLAVLVAILRTGPQAAFAGCNPGCTDGFPPTSYWAGWKRDSGVPTAITYNTAAIYNYANPYVVPGIWGDVSAWVMIVSSNGYGYIQVGWLVNGNGRHTFTEWGAGGNASIVAETPGTTTWYEVGASSGTNYCFFVNGASVGSCTGNLGWYGYEGQDYGEIRGPLHASPYERRYLSARWNSSGFNVHI